MSSIELNTIGVVVGPHKSEAWTLVNSLDAWCQERGVAMKLRKVEEAPAFDWLAETESELTEHVDLIVSLGGDGTMLSVARFVGTRQVPVLGVNLGSLGYLTEFTKEELFVALEELREGSFFLDRRMLLDVRLTRGDEIIASQRALNEAVVNFGSPVRMVELECRINGMFVNSFRADGMILATPTGSTAYSLSAGGPIVHPSMSAILLTPICPHTLSNRPVVVPGESVVDLIFPVSNDGLVLTVDGQVQIALQPGDQVTVLRSQTTFDLIRPTNRNYFEVLRRKLKWGTR
ncbi:MAG: NAD(+)/NADH kinase [Acidobacteria bacterium]|nr:NAD(+)/NADH kinase [Acidobacteriota bacterium]